MTNPVPEALPFLPAQERLSAYKLITDGCSHIYSKNKLQEEKAQKALETLIPLTKNDPYFLAHLTSYVFKNLPTKDLQVFLAYVASLSSADGTPFSVGSKYIKPNLRYIGAAALHRLDPKLACRVLELASRKFAIEPYLNEARHFPTALRTAFIKYLQYREKNVVALKNAKKAGLAGVIKKLYRGLHKAPTDEVAKILRWQQKDKKITFEESMLSFKGLTDLEIAEKIRKEKLPVLGVLGALPRKMSPVVAVALLEQVSGNQAVILREMFESAGVLKDKEVMALYEEKIKLAKTALDRVDTLAQNASEDIKRALKTARAAVRKEEMRGLGKIYIHLDDSGSMESFRNFAIERGAIIAECVNNPQENFAWGMFGSRGQVLPLPQEFEKDAFAQILFGYRDGGGTDCFALYPTAREFGAEIDIFITDQQHTHGTADFLARRIQQCHVENPNYVKPKACVIVNFFNYGRYKGAVQYAYEQNGIPVAVMEPDSLTQSALVVQAVKSAMLGPVAMIDEIMDTELLKLPNYYYTL